MVWEVATREKALPNPLSTYKAGSGDTALFLWALGDGLAHYALAERWITAMPLYLDQTLAACALLWMAQKLVGMFLRRSQSLPLTSNPTLLTRPEPLDVLVVARPKGVERAPNFGRDAPPSPLSNITLPSDPITTKATTPPASSRRKTGPKPAKEELEKKLMDFIQLKGQAQTGDLVVALGAARRTINRCLDKLLSEGRLERQGKARAAVYRVKESPKNEVVEEEKGQP
jgi:hypothetical protein